MSILGSKRESLYPDKLSVKKKKVVQMLNTPSNKNTCSQHWLIPTKMWEESLKLCGGLLRAFMKKIRSIEYDLSTNGPS